MNYRQALIHAAVCGWNGDEPGSWPAPADEKTILAWGGSYLDTNINENDLRPELMKLVAEGLFFQVHPDDFESPCYYCTYDLKFIEEIFDTDCFDITDAIDFLSYFPKECDEEYSTIWRTEGLCSSQEGQSTSWGPCLGKDCPTFKRGNSKCLWGLEILRK
jgi:hypothetical protein